MNKMTDEKEDFDEFVNKLQQEIIDKEIEDFNERIVELFHNPKNWGKPSRFNISYSYTDARKDTMKFFLTIDDDIIHKANFYTDGCGATVAAGSQVTLLIEGKPIEFAKNLNAEDIERTLQGFPSDHKHSLELTIRTLKGLIEKYNKNKG